LDVVHDRAANEDAERCAAEEHCVNFLLGVCSWRTIPPLRVQVK
jgi:hypothetical protein